MLIVDDDRIVAEALAEAITALGCRAIRAGDGWQALEELERERPAVMLVDLSLPGMSGSALMRIVRENPIWSRIPRVIITATNDPMIGVREDAPVFYKPLDLDSLMAVVQRYCERADVATPLAGAHRAQEAAAAPPRARPRSPVGMGGPSLHSGSRRRA